VGQDVRPVQHREDARPGGQHALERVAVAFGDQTHGYGYVRGVLAAVLVVARVHRHQRLVNRVDYDEGVGTRGLSVVSLVGERASAAVEDEDGGAEARLWDGVSRGLLVEDWGWIGQR
jgi:hypothetical protein